MEEKEQNSISSGGPQLRGTGRTAIKGIAGKPDRGMVGGKTAREREGSADRRGFPLPKKSQGVPGVLDRPREALQQG